MVVFRVGMMLVMMPLMRRRMLSVLTRIQRRFGNADAHAVLAYASHIVAEANDFGGVGEEREETWGGVERKG
jgi:hypothetical protein